MFAKHCKLDWAQVQDLARDFDNLIREKWPRYYEELQGESPLSILIVALLIWGYVGIAAGAKRDLIDIIALNVRTEIVFGQFSDGCTSLYYQGDGISFQGQNWDVRTIAYGPLVPPLS